MTQPIHRVQIALLHARTATAFMAATYAISLTVGIAMVHTGNAFALRFRDRLVSRAHQTDPVSRADDAGEHGRAAAIDFSRNLLAAVPETISGLTLVMPVALGAYRGWVGGIVSVDSRHASRLARRRSAVYYLVTLAFQMSGFTLAAGAGLYLGLAFFRREEPFWGPPLFRLPRAASIDVAWLYVLVVPLFAIGSLWEFFHSQ